MDVFNHFSYIWKCAFICYVTYLNAFLHFPSLCKGVCVLGQFLVSYSVSFHLESVIVSEALAGKLCRLVSKWLFLST